MVELTGNPGDVFLTDLRLLHTLSPNTRRTPRIMATQRYLLESVRTKIYGGGNTEAACSNG